MSTFQAGFGRSDITPGIGCRLIGYGNRSDGATGVHDPLYARSLVLEDEGGRWAMVSIEFCFVHAETVQKIREAIQRRVDIPATNVFIATTHTHAGPDDRQGDNWERPLAEIVADAVEAACKALQPARIGSGYGFLYGHSINRRWLDRPVDPALAVIRVDDIEGKPLGLVTNFACHAVVMGYDNLLISGDWPGYACTKLEETLGTDTICLFFQGGSGDINPIVEGVRKHLQGDQTVRAIGAVSVYYGSPDDPEQWNIGDRGGGTFEEVAELGEAFMAEVLRVAHRISSCPPSGPLWSVQRIVNAAADPDEPQLKPSAGDLRPTTGTPTNLAGEAIETEIMALGVGNIVWVGQPGEVFSETAVAYRTKLRLMGYAAPMLVSYANDRLSYLPVPEAFDEGGYEPGRAIQFGTSRHFQARAWEAIAPVLQQRSAD
jgi:neutral ceramidase